LVILLKNQNNTKVGVGDNFLKIKNGFRIKKLFPFEAGDGETPTYVPM
jgi:hypothetical protein